MAYPNQRTVIIDKPESFITYATYGKDELAFACRVLKPSGFKVWLYLLSNYRGISWDISPSDAETRWGIPTSSFHDGIKELEEKGFLDNQAIHMSSTKDESEIRKKKRKDAKSEKAHRGNPKFVESLNESRKEQSEIAYTNNINNKITNNKNINSAPITSDCRTQNPTEEANQNPKEEKKLPILSEAEMDYRFNNHWDPNVRDWRKLVENDIWCNPYNGAKVKIRWKS